MRDKNFVPCNLFDWPRAASLLPEQKFIYQSLWAAGFLATTGWGELPARSFAAYVSLPPDALMTGIKNLVDAGLILYAQDTNEIFVLDWFRFNTFKGVGVQIALRELQKIRSEALKKVILEKSNSCLPPSSPSPPPSSPPPSSPPPSSPPSLIPPPPGGSGGGLFEEKIKPAFTKEELAEFAESAAWNLRSRGEQVGPGFMPYIVKRIEEGGPNQTDLQQLQAFRAFKTEADAKVEAEAAAAVLAEADRQEKARADTRRRAALDHFDSLSSDQQESTRQQFLRYLEDNAAVLVPLFQKHGPTANPLVKNAFQNWLVAISPPSPIE